VGGMNRGTWKRKGKGRGKRSLGKRMRTINSEERIIIESFLMQLQVDCKVLEGVLVAVGKRIYLVKKEVLKTAREMEKKGVTPYCLGVETGTIHEEFEPSVELAGLISGYTSAKTVISEEGEKLFSYGRDVFVGNIVEGEKEGMRIVVNERGEVLGLGRFDGDMLRNVVDKGFYLRGKRGRKSMKGKKEVI
jgi:60S ribosome subunit biogenesis protein NIP7